MSFWREVDDVRDASTDLCISTSEIVPAFMPRSRMVNACPPGSPLRDQTGDTPPGCGSDTSDGQYRHD
jgi:hypothetical protein